MRIFTLLLCEYLCIVTNNDLNLANTDAKTIFLKTFHAQTPHPIQIYPYLRHLRGGQPHEKIFADSDVNQQESDSMRLWANAAPEQRKLFSKFALEMDDWLRKERGINLKSSNRSMILECIDHVSQPRERTEPSRTAPLAPEARQHEITNITAGRVLTVDELNERMWLACQLGDEDIVCQAVADGAEVLPNRVNFPKSTQLRDRSRLTLLECR